MKIKHPDGFKCSNDLLIFLRAALTQNSESTQCHLKALENSLSLAARPGTFTHSCGDITPTADSN